MGNRNNSVRDNTESLIVENSNNRHVEDENQDVNLLIDNQLKTKKIFAVKNPVILKRNTLQFSRDATYRKIHYISFYYDAAVEFNMNIYFNTVSCRDFTNKDKKGKNVANYLYTSGENFVSKTIRLYDLPKGQNVKFFKDSVFVDIDYFNAHKENSLGDESYDVVIEIIPKLMNNNNMVTSDTADRLSKEVILLTLCKIAKVESGSGQQLPQLTAVDNEQATSVYKLKTQLQRLKMQTMWLELNEVYNSALETGECLICCVRDRNTIFLPCKHSCSCQNCAHSLRMRNNPCPICKNGKIFLTLDIEDLIIIETEDELQNLPTDRI